MATKKRRYTVPHFEAPTNIVKMNNLDGSGIDVVLTTTIFAIIGAIALQKGGAVAAEVAREKVLKRLGIL
jgi:hypothetical protein